MNRYRVARLWALTAVMALFSSLASAQQWERHTDSDPAQALYCRSAYAHGYIHGYEDGFLQGDIELQMGRTPRPFEEFKSFRDADAGYKSNFGSKDLFRLGYRQGFREAYIDASHDGSFRAVSEIINIAQGMSLVLAPNRDFDVGFSKGYEAGRQHGLETDQPPGEIQLLSQWCRSNSPNRNYCDGYARGFRLGNADGRARQSSRRTQTAQNSR